MARRTWSHRVAVVASVVFATGLLAACDDTSEDDTSSLLCNVLDPEVAQPIVGDVTVSAFGGDNLDATRRQGNGLDCQVTTGKGSETLISIALRDTTDQADWEATKARFAKTAAGEPACTPRTNEPFGYTCEGIDGTDETTVALLFDNRWVRVVARTRDGDAPPDPDSVVAIAEDVDANLDAYDEKQ
ncbi:hypothetical protein [Mumia quercus]|uniref:hypothetical protein n=1 Tax=Mumia quercus TaxID=2976125 RepID=UPI0021D34BC4|nr:hypothetical protein [Mumia quercus]